MSYPSDKKGHSLLRIVFVLFLLVGLLAGSTSCRKQEKPAAPREKITIAVARQVMSAPLIIAAEKGYFAEEGLDVTIKNYAFGRLCLEAMLAGDAHLATVAQIPMVLNGFKRDDFSIIAGLVYNYDESKIIVRKDKIRTVAELRGKKIGVSFGTSSYFFLDIYLAHSNVPKSSVELINILAQDLPAAMKNGEIDAISTFEPYASETMRLLQDKATRMEKVELFREIFSLVGMKDSLKNHPEAIKKVLRSIERAIAFLKENKRKSIEILARKLEVDDKFLETAWDGYVFDLFLDNSLLIGMEDQARWAIKNKLTDKTKVPNYLAYVYPEALQAVKPDAVAVIKQE